MTRNGEEPAALPGDFYGYADLLEPTDRDLLDKVRGFLAEHVAPIALDQWERAEFPHHLVPEIAGLDIAGLGIDFPDRPARSKLCTSFVSAEFARVDASMATFFGVHTGLAMGTIDECGSEEQRERWLPPMRRMEAIGSFGLTEPDGGSDVAGGVHTTARRDGGTWVLNGAKRWIGNATFADLEHHLGPRRGRRRGQGLRRREGHPGLRRPQDRAQARAAHRAERRHRAHRLPGAGGEPAGPRELLPRHRPRAAGHPRRGGLERGRGDDEHLRAGPGLRRDPRAVRPPDREVPAGPGALWPRSSAT